jgi:hypothetical protein
VRGDDDGGEEYLSYFWSVISAPSGGHAYFQYNGDNGAKTTNVEFTAAGNYTFCVTIYFDCVCQVLSCFFNGGKRLCFFQ